MSPDAPRLYLARPVLDAVDVDRAMAFWRAALGYELAFRHETFAVLKDPRGKHMPLGFQPTDEPKRDVSPLHLEVFTDDMEREARRLEALGATRAADWPYGEDEPNWIVMRDPDGHEFCVVQLEAGKLDF